MALQKRVKEFSQYLNNGESILERDFKHVADKIELHWGYPEFYPFINKLMVNATERSKRSGFPYAVMQEINALYEIHSRLYPK